MKKLDTSVVVLLTVVMFAVSAAVIALVFAMVNQGKPRPQTADMCSVAAAPEPPPEKPAQPTTAGSTPKITPPLPTPRRTRRPTQPAKRPDTPGPDSQQQPEQADADAEGDAQDTAAVTLDGSGSRVSIQINPGTTSGSAPLAAMARVKSMSLTEGQRAAIEQFETAFQQMIDARLDYQRNTMEQVAEQLRQAYASGDKALIAQARAQMQDAAKAQADDIRQLNREYLDGIRKYLNDGQVRAVEKSIDRGGQVWGYATTQSGDEPPQVTIIQPNITVEQPENPPDENAE